jgi:hypothetical protein
MRLSKYRPKKTLPRDNGELGTAHRSHISKKPSCMGDYFAASQAGAGNSAEAIGKGNGTARSNRGVDSSVEGLAAAKFHMLVRHLPARIPAR